MNRRQFLSMSALSISLSGCIDGNFGSTTGTETPRNTATDTETPREGGVPDCWPSMCEGTKLVEVVVAHGFSGDVSLEAECRGEEFSVQSGESVQIDREEDAETCEIRVFLDRERVFSENVDSYRSLTLTVNSTGEVEVKRAEY